MKNTKCDSCVFYGGDDSELMICRLMTGEKTNKDICPCFLDISKALNLIIIDTKKKYNS